MKRRLLSLLLILAAQSFCFAGEIWVYFAPGDDCENAIVHAIDNAHDRVWCQYYGFSSVPVGDALLRAKARGLDIEVIVDRSNLSSKYSQAARLAKAGIPVFVDSAHPIAHNKVTICDRSVLLIGSYNPTVNAKKNAENLQLQQGFSDVVRAYVQNWTEHRGHSQEWPATVQRKIK